MRCLIDGVPQAAANSGSDMSGAERETRPSDKGGSHSDSSSLKAFSVGLKTLDLNFAVSFSASIIPRVCSGR